MRQMRLLAALTAFSACALSSVAPAEAGRLLVFDDKKVRAYDEPALPAAGPALARSSSGVRRVRVSRRDPVKRALSRALLAGEIQPGDRDRYLKIYRAAVRLRSRLGLTRARELGYVIDTLRLIGRRKQLSASRMPALFLILDRNREWWGSKGPPASGARVRFAPSEIIFQYYPGRGLQLQPLANFGFANGLWQSNRDERLRALISELVPLRVSRGGFSAWEYYFHFGGGSPPVDLGDGAGNRDAGDLARRARGSATNPCFRSRAKEWRRSSDAPRPVCACRAGPAPGTRSTASRRGSRS